MFKLAELEAAVSSLANQLDAGIALREAVRRMMRLQPNRTEFWSACEVAVGRGQRLSEMLREEWPLEYVIALQAGEEAGSLPSILRQMHQSILLQKQVRSAFTKLIGPVLTLLGGIGVFFFFMVGVIPSLQAGLGGGEKSFVFKLSSIIHDVMVNHWLVVAASVGGAIAAVVAWLSSAANRQIAFGYVTRIPMLGDAFLNLLFGQWAYTMSILDQAGIPAKAQLQHSIKTMPEVYQDGIALMAEEVEKRGRGDAANPDKQVDGDPRKQWPFYIATAFMTAHETGRLDTEMRRIAPILVDEGIRKLTRFVQIADAVTKLLSMMFIGAPMLAYFTQLSNSLSKAFSA